MHDALGLVFVGAPAEGAATGGDPLGDLRGSAMLALNASTGELVWRYSTPSIGRLGISCRGGLAVTKQNLLLFPACDCRVHAVVASTGAPAQATATSVPEARPGGCPGCC